MTWHREVRTRRKAPWSCGGLLTEVPFTGKRRKALASQVKQAMRVPRERAMLGAQAAVRLEPARRCLVSDCGCQRTARLPVKAPPAPTCSEREGSTIREAPQGTSRTPRERMHGARGQGLTTAQRCDVRQDRPEWSRPKLALANSCATSLRFSRRELRWAVKSSLTARRCVVTPRDGATHGVRDTGSRAGDSDSSQPRTMRADRKSVV